MNAAAPVPAAASRWLGLSAWLAIAWFFAATLHAAFSIELGFDPAYHASVAKNFAQGYGWASSYDRAFPFNPDVTTGPAMLLPAAGMITLFGNALWVPGVTAALLQLALYALILWPLRRCFDGLRAFHTCAIALSLLFAIHAHTWWLSLTADFLVTLSLWLAALLLVWPGERPWRLRFGAGLALGGALLAKALAWFGVAGIGLYLSLRLWRSQDRAAVLRETAALLLGALVLLLPWKLYEHAGLSALGEGQRAERAAYARDFFLEQGTGLRELAATESLPTLLVENLQRNGGLLAKHLRDRYGLPPLLSLLLGFALVVATALRLLRSETPLQNMLLLLGLIASLQLLWYLLLSHSWNAKYALAPIVFGGVMLAAALAQRGRAGWLIGVLLLSLLWLPAPTRSYVLTLATFRSQPTDYTQDMLSTRDYLLARGEGAPLAGCGWVFVPWEFEYLLPGSQHFRDCRGLIAEGLRFDADDYLARNPDVRAEIASGRYTDALDHHRRANRDGRHAFRYEWVKPVEFDLVINHVFWSVSAYRDRYRPILDACLPQTLHRTRYFTVAYCSAEGLRRHLPLDRDSELLPSTPPQFYIHKPLPIR